MAETTVWPSAWFSLTSLRVIICLAPMSGLFRSVNATGSSLVGWHQARNTSAEGLAISRGHAVPDTGTAAALPLATATAR